MNDRQKINVALDLLQGIRHGPDQSWITNAMTVDEVIRILRMPGENNMDTVTAKRVPRAGLSDRLFALLGKRARDARAAAKK